MATLAPDATSFLASNGQTYTKAQLNDWYNQIDTVTGGRNRDAAFADATAGAALGMNAQDIYNARSLVGLGDRNPGAPAAPSAQSNPYTAPSTQNLGMGQPAQAAPPMQTWQEPAGQPAPAAQSSSSAQFGRNPYLQQQGQALQAQSNQNLQQNILPGIGRGAQAAGMYGSSRQGIAEGQAMGNAQTGLDSAIANLYSNSYGQDLQYDLSSRSLNNSYDLGLRSNDLGYANLDANINQDNFGNQLQSANFGLGVYDRMNSYNQQNIQNATNMQNTPMNYFNNFNGNANQIAGQGGTSTNSQNNPGNPYLGALGGLQLGSQLFK